MKTEILHITNTIVYLKIFFTIKRSKINKRFFSLIKWINYLTLILKKKILNYFYFNKKSFKVSIPFIK